MKASLSDRHDPPRSVLVTVDDLAERYDVSPRTIFNWLEEGRLSCYRMGRVLRFHPAETDLDLKAFRVSARLLSH